MRMADEKPSVNQAVALRRCLTLVKELSGPVEESTELIRIGHKIDNERYRGQHEDRISHGIYPAPTC
jgi:hypothetical protein